MFTLRSARALQTFARVPGRSSVRMVNSLVVGMWGTSFVDCGTARSHSRAVGENSVDMRVDAIIRLPPTGFKLGCAGSPDQESRRASPAFPAWCQEQTGSTDRPGARA